MEIKKIKKNKIKGKSEIETNVTFYFLNTLAQLIQNFL